MWPVGKGHIVDEKLKVLMQELGNAINESLSDSDRIAGAIGEIRRAGYDVFLVLEARSGSTSGKSLPTRRRSRKPSLKSGPDARAFGNSGAWPRSSGRRKTRSSCGP